MDFDILKQPGDATIVVTFDHVTPTAHDMLELYFTPVTYDPLINVIEVEPESITIRYEMSAGRPSGHRGADRNMVKAVPCPQKRAGAISKPSPRST
jgi:hypothetical protein